MHYNFTQVNGVQKVMITPNAAVTIGPTRTVPTLLPSACGQGQR